MKPTLSQMNKWFEEFNLTVFNGKLPKVPIKFNNTYRQLGQFYWGPTRGIGIKISLFYDRTEEQYRNCLLHEMCHLYCYKQGWYNEGHGRRWKAIADKAYRITGLHIQRCEQAGAFKPSACNQAKADAVKAKKTAPAIIVDIEYETYHFLVKMTKNVLCNNTYSNGDFKISSRNAKVRVYISDDERFQRWQSSRTLHRGYRYNLTEYDYAIAPILKKAIEVERKNLNKLFYHGEYDCLGIR